jgi:hypothetical protein
VKLKRKTKTKHWQQCFFYGRILAHNGMRGIKYCMIEPHVVRDFITEQERQLLVDWITDNHAKEYFQSANMGRVNTQWTTRYWGKEGEDQCLLVFPDVVYTIQARVKTLLNLDPTNHKIPPFKHGIAAYYYVEHAGISEHTDAIWYPQTYTVHANIIVQAAQQGGITRIGADYWPTGTRDLLVYPVSRIGHRVNRCQGSTPRLLWTWAFCPLTHRYDPATNTLINENT